MSSENVFLLLPPLSPPIVVPFLRSDIAVVDMSDVFRQPSLFYHLGVRESFDMANNVILYHDTDPDTAQSLKVIHTYIHTQINLVELVYLEVRDAIPWLLLRTK